MTLEQQVCSLELSKELKELGYPQESLFYWYQTNSSILKSDIGKLFWEIQYKDSQGLWNVEKISAPTVAELGEVLKEKYPMCVEGETIVSGKWKIDSFEADTEADARAKALIYWSL